MKAAASIPARDSAPAPARREGLLPGHPLLSEITLEYGPRELLGQFFLRAEAAARVRGVHLSFAPLSELVETNRRHRESWRPLIPVFDPAHGIAPGASFGIVGRNSAGDIVATQAARLYAWGGTSFQEEAESLRLFYQNPGRSKGPTEEIHVSAAGAPHVTGQVVFSGGGWYRPDYRKRWLSGILPRISRAYAFTRWSSDFTVSIMADGVIKGGMAERCGYTNVDWFVDLKDTPVGTVRCALVWMQAKQLVEDLEAFLERFDAEIDRVVYDRAG